MPLCSKERLAQQIYSQSFVVYRKFMHRGLSILQQVFVTISKTVFSETREESA